MSQWRVRYSMQRRDTMTDEQTTRDALWYPPIEQRLEWPMTTQADKTTIRDHYREVIRSRRDALEGIDLDAVRAEFAGSPEVSGDPSWPDCERDQD